MLNKMPVAFKGDQPYIFISYGKPGTAVSGGR